MKPIHTTCPPAAALLLALALLGSLPARATYCTVSSLELADDGTVSSQRSISEVDFITDLDVRLDLTHAYVGDLSVTLEHVSTGTVVNLIDRPADGACSGDDILVTLDDEAALPVADQCASPPPALGGSLRPEAPLSAFDGERLDGTWRLWVTDSAAGDSGTLNEWCLDAALDEADYLPLSSAPGLIVPGFEVDVDNPAGKTTYFAVRNTSDEAIEGYVAYYGKQYTQEPLRTDPFTLGPRQTLTHNVRADLEELEVAGGLATGLIVISEASWFCGYLGRFCAPNLEGDFIRLDADNDFATGDRLLHPDQLCRRQEVRFLDFGSGSKLRILVDDPQLPGPSFSFTAYDEAGGLIAEGERDTPDNLTILNATDLAGSTSFGTIVFDFSSSGGGFVTAEYSAFGRFSLELNSACLEE